MKLLIVSLFSLSALAQTAELEVDCKAKLKAELSDSSSKVNRMLEKCKGKVGESFCHGKKKGAFMKSCEYRNEKIRKAKEEKDGKKEDEGYTGY